MVMVTLRENYSSAKWENPIHLVPGENRPGNCLGTNNTKIISGTQNVDTATRRTKKKMAVKVRVFII
jgi:hypothetical protein